MILAALALGVAPTLAGSTVATEPPDVAARVTAKLAAMRAEDEFAGATFAWVLADGSSGEVAVGHADADREIPLVPGSRMPAGAIGKTHTAAVVLQLCAEEELELDAPIARVLHDVEWLERLPNGAELTLRHLLEHRSGLTDFRFQPPVWGKLLNGEPWKFSPADLIAVTLGRAPRFAPGERFEPVDTNYVVIGVVLERALGKSWYAALQERLLTPLELFDTTPLVGRKHRGLVQGHLASFNVLESETGRTLGEDGRFMIEPEYEWTAGGLVANATDLARWARALYAGDVLPRPWLERMLDAKPTGSKHVPGGYGLGTAVWKGDHGPVYGHSGWFPGYSSEIGYFPEHGLAVAVMFNTDDASVLRGSTRDYLEELAGAVLAP